ARRADSGRVGGPFDARSRVRRCPRRARDPRRLPADRRGVSNLVAEQKRYYAERAPEYDDWWYRRGRYELETNALARWQADAAEAETALEAFAHGGTVLEFAAGTGIWTHKLVRLAERLVAVDANGETLA